MKAPEKYGIGYKLFEAKEDGRLYPLFIGKNEERNMSNFFKKIMTFPLKYVILL